MLSIRGAATIPEKEQFIAPAEAGGDRINDSNESIHIVAQKSLLDPDALFKSTNYRFFHKLFS